MKPLILCLVFLTPICSVESADWSRLLRSFTETAGDARAGVYGAEDAGAMLAGRGQMLREAAEKEARHLGGVSTKARVDDLAEALGRAFAKQGADPSTIAFLRTLPEEQIQAAAVYARGGRRLHEAVPDLVIRDRIHQQGGAPMLGALGMVDDIPPDDFMKIEALIAAGRLPAETAGTPTLAKLGGMLGGADSASRDFYSRHIRGHEKLWLGGGALAAWIAAPDAFQDAAGRLTEAGFTRLGALAGEVNAGAIRGLAEGSKQAVLKTAAAAKESFFDGKDAWAAWLGVVVLIAILFVAFPVLRRLIAAVLCLRP